MWYWIFCAIFSVIGRSLFKLKVEGIKNIPSKTNFIIVSNHNSFLDPLVFMAVIPKKIYCIALRDIYKINWMAWFLKAAETLPSGSASEKAVALLHQNKNIGLFPEGGVSRDGKLKEFRRGVALLAYKTGRPIVPCAILGTFESLPFGSRIPKLRPIKLKIGKPIYFSKEFDEEIDSLSLQDGILKIRTTIKGMLNAG
ncbi:MAG: lysophospholipid acyltransferase family protein [Candidatus Omnitrophota bacterium]|nr:1-acyl-sn-glycerol-3-phosphate acyltransferase [Candidatus Omnitrophota bacterium]MBU1929224.1 1-acyl-sn-glycerol-3-phosphate acyltransferase [Candidatus Omnitrophota bacterium]MBU2034527.1 1-acyl-sn-glycerol-3-phosphate acyltransferase [Candidatus Omnitrophota bacterium]MBU2221809.1 1-acyl-sn-glycerol-3-phosphate acyltransferase [Candidatus Omnitrophota bacterium]MBU2258618.1 1-acyl-sn-glycerol-3-phosphate acyltransferase [Candidatus Omnitrophota bacterium]